MELDDIQRDTLRELINVAFGRAASALSKVTGHRVEIEAPDVTMCEVRDLAPTLGAVLHGDVATVHQLFSGPVAGDALLILDESGAATLSRLLTTAVGHPGEDGARDVLTEVGNILLNACLGTLGNLLEVHVTFSVPRLSVATVAAMVDSVLVVREELRYALVVQAAFRLRGSEVEGYLLIVLTVDSLARLLRAMRESEQRVEPGALHAGTPQRHRSHRTRRTMGRGVRREGVVDAHGPRGGGAGGAHQVQR